MATSDTGGAAIDCNPAFWAWVCSQGVQQLDVPAQQEWYSRWQQLGCPRVQGMSQGSGHFGNGSSARNSMSGQLPSGHGYSSWEDQVCLLRAEPFVDALNHALIH